MLNEAWVLFWNIFCWGKKKWKRLLKTYDDMYSVFQYCKGKFKKPVCFNTWETWFSEVKFVGDVETAMHEETQPVLLARWKPFCAKPSHGSGRKELGGSFCFYHGEISQHQRKRSESRHKPISVPRGLNYDCSEGWSNCCLLMLKLSVKCSPSGQVLPV